MRWVIISMITWLLLTGCGVPEEKPMQNSLLNAGNDKELAERILYTGYSSPVVSLVKLLWDYGDIGKKQDELYQASRKALIHEAWNSPSFQYLFRNKDLWREPAVVDLQKIQVGEQKITGILRFNLIPATSVFDKPAYLEFEASPKGEEWLFTKFGVLKIEKTTTFDGREIEDRPDMPAVDVVITIKDGAVQEKEMETEELVWFVMGQDNDGYGLGMGFRLVDILAKGKNDPVIFVPATVNSPGWQYLFKNRKLWKGPMFLGVDDWELDGRNRIRGVVQINLYQNIGWMKLATLEFELTKNSGGWKYTHFGKLKVIKSDNPEAKPEEDVIAEL